MIVPFTLQNIEVHGSSGLQLLQKPIQVSLFFKNPFGFIIHLYDFVRLVAYSIHQGLISFCSWVRGTRVLICFATSLLPFHKNQPETKHLKFHARTVRKYKYSYNLQEKIFFS
jgi:hypothetical protein